jgi:hypothetical protein
MVPTSVVIEMLIKAPDLTELRIAEILRRTGLRATIHVEEDQRLNKLGLKEKMPDSFWDPDSELHNDPLARYKEAQLFDGLVERIGASWFPPSES